MHTLALVAITLWLQATPTAVAPPTALRDEVGRLAAASTNEARFDALTGLLRAHGVPFTVEPFTIDKPVRQEPRTTGQNVVVTFGEGARDIVIGAHYDAARLPDGSLSRGAVDNAASSVILVRLAEALRADPPAARVTLVWFDMEELGLLGSAQFVKQRGPGRIATMVNFDINAYGDTILFGPTTQAAAASLRRTFVETCAAEDIACVGFAQMPPGDDRSFVAAGVPAVSVAVLPGVEAHQLWLMMNAGAAAGLAPGTTPPIFRTIHTPDDTLDKVSDEAMARVHRFALALVRNIARVP